MQAYNVNMDKGSLTVEDLKQAEKEIIRFCQTQQFCVEVSSLERGHCNLKRSSPLYKMDPVLQDGLLKSWRPSQ